MAKLAGGALGVRRGKVGAEVYSVTGGIQVVKQYQPVVANPNTEGQQLQRLKMMVVGKITKAITPDMLVGLGTRFSARSKFNKTMLRAAVARLSGGAGEWKAYVPPQALVFSEGVAAGSITAEPATLTNNSRTVHLTTSSLPDDWDYVKAIAVGGGARLDISNDFMAASVTIPMVSAASIDVPMPETVTEGAHIYLMFGRPINRAAQLDRNGGGVTEDELSLDGAETPETAGMEWSASQWVDWVAGTEGGGGGQ